MKDGTVKDQKHGITLEFDLDEPPQKVWRALSIPEFRENWLPKNALADPEPATMTPGEKVSYSLRDDVPPFLKSTVTFTIIPNATGGTRLRILHEPSEARPGGFARPAANGNSQSLKLAA